MGHADIMLRIEQHVTIGDGAGYTQMYLTWQV